MAERGSQEASLLFDGSAENRSCPRAKMWRLDQAAVEKQSGDVATGFCSSGRPRLDTPVQAGIARFNELPYVPFGQEPGRYERRKRSRGRFGGAAGWENSVDITGAEIPA
jgi:hypothetical protein